MESQVTLRNDSSEAGVRPSNFSRSLEPASNSPARIASPSAMDMSMIGGGIGVAWSRRRKSSLSDLLLFENDEAPGVPLHDVQEVSNYVTALNHGLSRLREASAITATDPRNP